MINTRHHWFLFSFFEWYARIRIRCHFRSVHMIGELPNAHRPLLVIANHFSWWDGFFISWLNRRKFHKKFHLMMLEEQLNKNWFFRYTGVFPIRKNSKSALRSLDYATELLRSPENMVVFFPQGKFESMYEQPLHFEKGLEWLIKNLKNEIRMVFVANQTEYFDSPAPRLFMHYKTYDYRGKRYREIEKDYQTFFAASYRENLKIINQ